MRIGLRIISSILFVTLWLGDSCLAQGDAFYAIAIEKFTEKDYDATIEFANKAALFYRDDQNVKGEIKALSYVNRGYIHQFMMDESEILCHQMLKLSGGNGLDSLYIEALGSITSLKSFKNELDSVYHYAKIMYEMPGILSSDTSNCYTMFGNYWDAKLELDSAEYYFSKAVEMDRLLQDSSSFAFNALELGVVKFEQGHPEKAIELTLEGYAWLREKDTFKRATFYRFLGIQFTALRNFEKAESYLKEAIKLCKDHKMPSTETKSLAKLGFVYEMQYKYEQALATYTEGLERLKISKKKTLIADMYIGIAYCKMAIKDTSDMKNYFQLISDNIDQIESEQSKLRFNFVKAKYAISKNEVENLSTLMKAIKPQLLGVNNIFFKRDWTLLNAKLHEFKGDFSSSLSSYKAYYQIKDSLYEITQTALIHNLEAKYNRTQQDNMITVLEGKDNFNQEKISIQSQAIGGGATVLLLLAILLFHLNRQKKKIALQHETISVALNEKEILLREIHHRVKNNLQVISSLLSLQGKYTNNPHIEEAIREGKDRVKSMSLIHQNLYQKNNLTGVSVHEYFENLFRSLFSSYNIDPDRIKLDLQIAPLKLDVDTIVPIGLVVNELVSNALKYAFPGDRAGIVQVALYEQDDQLILEVIDNGVGVEDVDALKQGETFGFELIDAFTHKLNANLKISSRDGTQIALHIKKYKKVA